MLNKAKTLAKELENTLILAQTKAGALERELASLSSTHKTDSLEEDLAILTDNLKDVRDQANTISDEIELIKLRPKFA